jgi:hypothetical protein
MNARMNSPESIPDWLEPVQQRRPADAEVAALRSRVSGNPVDARLLEEELALNALLDSRPLPRVSSNFASQVWSEIDRAEATAPSPGTGWSLRLLRRLGALRSGPAMALGTVLVAAALGWGQVAKHRQSALANNLSEFSRTTPDVEVLRDFESIRAMAVKPEPGDLALIAALEGSSSVH